MKTTIYKWLWEGKQKWLILSVVASFLLFLGAYTSLFLLKSNLCVASERDCIDLWLNTLGAPFYWGFLLKAMMIAPLLLLPFSQRVFKVWAVMSIIFIPIAFYRVIFVAPITAQYFDKMAESNIMGEVYLVLTVGIIILVTAGEFVWKKVKR